MPKPRCLCTDRSDIHCDGTTHCDLAIDPKSIKGHCKDCCPICWLAIHSPPHRKLWGIDGEAQPAPPEPPQAPAVATIPPQTIIVPPERKIVVPAPSQAIPRPVVTPAPGVIRLGDRIESALSAVGVTKERVSAWLGAPCGCAERKNKLNRLSAWLENATKSALDKLLGE